MNSRTRTRAWPRALPAAALLLAAACDGSPPATDGSRNGAATPTSAPLASVVVALPEGYEPVVVTPWGEDVLVGSRAPEGSASRPRLTLLDPQGGSREIPVAPVSPTAFEAKWLVAVARGDTVDLVGGAPAGAHSNTRWSTWRGDTSSVRELPQLFETFGGLGAGALVSLVSTPSTPVVVGSWESAGAGLDIALWFPQGERWVRRPSTGTVLASTPAELVSARGATADGEGLLIPGSVTVLGEGSVTQRAAVWRAPAPDGPWIRVDLPSEGSLGEAHAAACDDTGRCTVVGAVDGTLRGWNVAADDSISVLALPKLPVGEHDLLPAPLLSGAEPTVVLASGGALIALTVRGDDVVQQTGPPARVVRSTARTASGDHVVLEEPTGTASLVRLTAP